MRNFCRIYSIYDVKRAKLNCTNQHPPQRGSSVPNPVWVELKWLLAFLRVPVTPGTPLTQTIFSPCSPLNDRRKVARSLFKIGLFSVFSCFSLARLLILLLLLMSGNVHPNPCPVFPCSVCAGNVTWLSRSVQCCTCFNWAHLKCSLLSFSRFRTLGSSHSWSCPPCCTPAFFGDATPTITVTSSSDSSSWYTSTAQSGSSGPLLLMHHSHPTLAFKPLILFPPTLYLLPPDPNHRLMILAVSLYLLLPLPLTNYLRVLQWNAGGLRARSTELLHFVSSHPVDLICIQESNLNSSSSFRIPGFSALRSDGTHSQSGIFSTNVTDASGGVIIFVRQGLSFSELSTSSLSSPDPYSDYVEVNISLNDSSSLSFLNVYAPSIRSSLKNIRTNFFSPSILPSYVEAETVEFSRFRFRIHRKRTASDSSFHFRFRFHIPGYSNDNFPLAYHKPFQFV